MADARFPFLIHCLVVVEELSESSVCVHGWCTYGTAGQGNLKRFSPPYEALH
jgi:hypothetical protein